MFEHVEPAAADPIYALVDAYRADPRTPKVNLSIGIYVDEAGQVPVLRSVRSAEQRLLAAASAKPYLPMEGDAAARAAVQALLFGANHTALRDGRIATIQTVGSSGALSIAAEFLQRWFADSSVWISDPSWENHRAIFQARGVDVRSYPYFDANSGGLALAAMLATFAELPRRAIVLLQANCHNPTGVDATAAELDHIIDALMAREAIVFVDLAYQGFGSSLDDDAHLLRALAERGAEFLVANSFSKNMSVYGERCGALSVVCRTAADAERVLAQLRLTVRRNYSSPAIHAAGIVATVLGDPALRRSWEQEVAVMRERILAMRRALHAALAVHAPRYDAGYLLRQRGMFAFTQLSTARIDRLREEFAVYLLRSGRLCVAGLNESNVNYTARAIASVLDR